MRYEYNVLGTKGPRRMMALVPALDAPGGTKDLSRHSRTQQRLGSAGFGSLLER